MGSFSNINLYNFDDDICGYSSLLPLLPGSQTKENYSLIFGS